MNPQNTTSLRVINNSLLIDDTDYFVRWYYYETTSRETKTNA